jgi:hypothetical protein
MVELRKKVTLKQAFIGKMSACFLAKNQNFELFENKSMVKLLSCLESIYLN